MSETADPSVDSRDEPSRTSGRAVALALVIDVLIVAFFAVYGRSSHGMNMDFAEVWRVAWPFLASLAVAWVISRVWKRPFAPLRSGLPVTIITVMTGMTLRYSVAQPDTPVQWVFVGITTALFAVLFIGWRAIATLITRRRSHRAT